jgi:hypothetical protein
MMKIVQDRFVYENKARQSNRLKRLHESERKENKINKFFRKSDYISFSDDRLN